MKNKAPNPMDPVVWGVYDTKDKLWMGDDKGPKLFSGTVNGVDAHLRARAAATILGMQFKPPTYRYRARPIPNSEFRHKDTVEADLTGEQALKRLLA